MIVAFISTDIIVVNRDCRLDEVKKILNIIWNSLEKIEQLGLPKILKTIWIQITDDDDEEYFEDNMKKIDNSFEKWRTKEISIKHILIETIERKKLKKVKNVLYIKDYLDQAKEAFLKIQKENTLLGHIENFNNAINGEDIFYIRSIIKKDFDNCYIIQKNKKESQLLKYYTKDKFKPPINSKESFADFINKQGINFLFPKEDVINKLAYYHCSEEFDKIYYELIYEKDYKADSSIFRYIYDIFISKSKSDEEIKKLKEEIEKLKEEIRRANLNA